MQIILIIIECINSNSFLCSLLNYNYKLLNLFFFLKHTKSTWLKNLSLNRHDAFVFVLYE